MQLLRGMAYSDEALRALLEPSLPLENCISGVLVGQGPNSRLETLLMRRLRRNFFSSSFPAMNGAKAVGAAAFAIGVETG